MNKTLNKALYLPRPFYGWIVVASVFVVLFLCFGCVYSFSTFFEALQFEFKSSRGNTSLIFSIAGFIYFSLGAISGYLADRVGARRVIGFGLLVIGGGMLLASGASEMWEIYAAYGVGMGIGVGSAYVPAVGLVQRWFVRKRGLASGIAVTGIGLGTLCMPPLAALLIHHAGWRFAYLVTALVVIFCGTGAALFIVDSPAKRGLLPDGDKATPATETKVPEGPTSNQTISLKTALRAQPFWLIYVGALMASLGLFVPFVHMVPYTRDLGLSKPTSIMLFSLIGAGSTLGRSLLGGFADCLGRRASLAGVYGGITVMFLWWLIATSVWELAVFAFMFGTFYGGIVALQPAVTADYFSGPHLSGILGAVYTSIAIGVLVGPTFAGLAFDISNTYTLPIVASAFAGLLATVSALFLKDPGQWREQILNRPGV